MGLSSRNDSLAAAPSICWRVAGCAVAAVCAPGPAQPRRQEGSGRKAGKEGAGSGEAMGLRDGVRTGGEAAGALLGEGGFRFGFVETGVLAGHPGTLEPPGPAPLLWNQRPAAGTPRGLAPTMWENAPEPGGSWAEAARTPGPGRWQTRPGSHTSHPQGSSADEQQVKREVNPEAAEQRGKTDKG